MLARGVRHGRRWSVVLAPGGGDWPARGTAYPALPPGNLSAVLPDRVRVFDASSPWRIRTVPMRPGPPLR